MDKPTKPDIAIYCECCWRNINKEPHSPLCLVYIGRAILLHLLRTIRKVLTMGDDNA